MHDAALLKEQEGTRGKPTLILHIGHSKTGTTALQQYLSKHAGQLLKQGYLFPTRRSIRDSHLTLAAGFVMDKGFESYHNQIYGDDFQTYHKDFLRFWKQLGKDIAHYAPHTVILSAEQMFRDFSAISRVPLAGLLAQYFSHVVVVAYVRSPAADYLSRVAQQIRSGYPVVPPAARRIRAVIEYYQHQFPGAVQVHAFERKQLLAGDIVQDFTARYISRAVPVADHGRVLSANTSLPWPLLIGLYQLRLHAQPGGGSPGMATRARLYVASKLFLRGAEPAPQCRVGLRPEVEDFIRRSAVDYLWLKQQLGVAFADLDYARIESIPSPFPAVVPLEQIVDLSQCPRNAVPVARYLGNGLAFRVACLFFVLRLKLIRAYRMFLR